MNEHCKEFVEYIITAAPKYNKAELEQHILARYNLIKDRKVLHNEYFAVRISYSKFSTGSFSNTVLSLSALEKYDKIPFFVVLVRKNADNLIFLANSSFIKKISHSSQNLSMTNIKGSFNGSDILRESAGLSNTPENFDFLFALHQGLDWEDNLSRLVEASANIRPTMDKFMPTASQTENVFKSIDRAIKFVSSANFNELENDLNERCQKCAKEIMIASHIENTNIRGRLIESLVASTDEERVSIIQNLKDIESALPSYNTKNGLGDYCRDFDNGDTYTDIKTKIIYLNSNPKAYNIDKFLQQMSDSRSVFLFFFIGIDETKIFKTVLCSVYHNRLIENTIFQHHWAGRNTRGVAQFNGNAIDDMLNSKDFHNKIDIKQTNDFLQQLLSR